MTAKRSAPKPYPPARQDRKKVIYALCLRNDRKKHYCLNRDYEILPVNLPAAAVEAIAANSVDIEDKYLTCTGTEMPAGLGDPEEWKTYWVFADNSSPKWIS